MGQTFATQVTADTTLTTTAETVVLTTAAISTPGPGTNVQIEGQVTITAGTGTTSTTIRVRRGTTTSGTLVGEANPEQPTAGNTAGVPFGVVDQPGEVAGQAYVVTVQQAGATANGSVSFAEANVSVGV